MDPSTPTSPEPQQPAPTQPPVSPTELPPTPEPVAPEAPTPTPAPTPAPEPPVAAPTPEAVPPMPAQAPLDPSMPVPAAPQPMAADVQPKKRRLPRWLIIVMAIVAGVILFGAIIYYAAMAATNAPKQVSDKFVDDMQANNATAAYALTASSFQKATSETVLATGFNQVSPVLQGTVTTIERSVNSSNGKTVATIDYSIATKAGTKYIRVELEDNSNNWQVNSFQSANTPFPSN